MDARGQVINYATKGVGGRSERINVMEIIALIMM
jgi:hypothetical protein